MNSLSQDTVEIKSLVAFRKEKKNKPTQKAQNKQKNPQTKQNKKPNNNTHQNQTNLDLLMEDP